MNESMISIAATTLPVLLEVDVAVAGASFAGCALAHAAARRGCSVLLVEPRTYPGEEVGALLRPWIVADARERPPALLAPWIAAASRGVATDAELALHPETTKVGLEDTLLEPGVKLLYASQPVGVVLEADRVAGIVIANKSGRQAALARVVVDATRNSVLARFAGAAVIERSSDFEEVRRTLEFTGVKGPLGTSVPLTEGAGAIANNARVHQGCEGEGHVLLEVSFRVERPAPGWRGQMALEIEARRRSMVLVEGLVQSHPAFSKAFFAAASWELWRLPSHRLRSAGNDPSIFVLGPATTASDDLAAGLLEPFEATRAGEALAAEVVDAARSARSPAPDRCATRCGKPSTSKGRATWVFEPKEPVRGRPTVRIAAPEESWPILANAEVAVAGGGTSGAAAAPAAASAGARTVLLEAQSGLGGTGTIGGVNTYWNGRRVGFTAEQNRRYAQCADRVGALPGRIAALDNRPAGALMHLEAKMHALLEWSLGNGAEVFFRTMTVGALVENGAVSGVVVATPEGMSVVPAQITVDATGDGDIAAFAGAKTTYGATRDRVTMWYSLAPQRRPGFPTNSFATAIDITNPWDVTRAIIAGRRRFTGYDHGPYLAPRETRHVLGAVTVTLRDQMRGTRYPDVVTQCSSSTDIKGKTAADISIFGLHAPDALEIPYRAVVPVDLDGILIAGKAFSATHEGLAGTRMQPDMINLGGACGLAAAKAVKEKIQPRNVNVSALQRELSKRGALPKSVLSRDVNGEPRDRAALEALLERAINESDKPRTRSARDAATEVCLAGPSMVPLLERAHQAATGPRRLLLARWLAWYESPLAVPDLVAALEEQLAGESLPALPPIRRWRHFPPDNAFMPDTARLVFALGLTRDRRVVPILERVVSLVPEDAESLSTPEAGIYYYVDVVCLVAERLADPSAVPALMALHRKPAFCGLARVRAEADIMAERRAYLELAIGRALARCTSVDGVKILADYLGDERALLAEHAHDELLAVSGEDFGKNSAAWLAWLEVEGRRLEPRPWLIRGEC